MKSNSQISMLELSSTYVRIAVYDTKILNQIIFYEEKIDYTRDQNLIPENTPHSISGGIIYFVSEMCNINITFICENENVLNNNSAIISHANESCEVSGDYSEAFRTVSRTMSNIRHPSASQSYISEKNDSDKESDNDMNVTEPIVKRQKSYSKKRPRLFF